MGVADNLEHNYRGGDQFHGPPQQQSSSGLAGVGVSLSPDVSGALRITAVEPGGPADRSGLVRVGDLLHEVEDRSVVGISGEGIRDLILGPIGSAITLGLSRGRGEPFFVRLQRGTTRQYPNAGTSYSGTNTPSLLPSSGPSNLGVSSSSVHSIPNHTSEKEGQEMCGIGIGITLDSHGALCITSLNEGGPADLSRELQPGDILRKVNGRDVFGFSPEEVRPLILGPVGSLISVQVQRGDTQLTVRLLRGRTQPGYSAAPSLAASSSSLPPYPNTVNQAPPPQPNLAGPLGSRRAFNVNPPVTNPGPLPNDVAPVGVGILLAVDPVTENLFVKNLTEGGSAQRSNMVRVGDILHSIDGLVVSRMQVAEIKPLILGPPGSSVTLGIERAGQRRLQNVRLVRRAVGVQESDARIVRTTPIPSPQMTPGGSPSTTPKITPLPTRSTSPSSSPVGTAIMPHAPLHPPQSSRPANYSEGAICGVGVVLAPSRSGALVVATVTEGGPAQRSGLIHKNDVLHQIDGKNVFKWTVEQVKPLILGIAGTTITLGVHRESEDTFVFARIMREPVRLGEVSIQEQQPVEFAQPEPHPVQYSGHDSQKLYPQDYVPPGLRDGGNAPAPVEEAGIGLMLAQMPNGHIQIRSINAGGPAEKSGLLRRGDIIRALDGKNVHGMSVASLRPFILGPIGSPITLSIQRVGTQNNSKRALEVTLIRGKISAAPAPQAPIQHHQMQQQQRPMYNQQMRR